MNPLVSCIMPTNNRRNFVPQAIRYFLLQDYENRELLIVDDGSDCIRDLVPENSQIRYIRLDKKMTLGEKRNYCVRECTGDLIMHWDDDDWMAPHRISYQVSELLKHNAEVCGLRSMYYREIETDICWLYTYPSQARPWLAGGSLLYTRNFWEEKPFRDMQVASDTQFVFDRILKNYFALSDNQFYIASIHRENTSPKKTSNNLWKRISSDVVENIMKGTQHGSSEETITYRKKRVAVLITTCQRPMLKSVIASVQREADLYDVNVVVVDDTILQNGKKNYWKTINNLWNQVRNLDFDYYFQLPDDVQWSGRLIRRAIHQWESIDDPKKICLNLLFDNLRMGKTCWTNYWPRLSSFGWNRFLQTQWVDMAFMCERNFFEQLQWQIQPIPASRWIANPELSSGVGQQISVRLSRGGWNLYQPTKSLLEHSGAESLMNPELRQREPISSARLPFIYAGMATIPEREGQLKRTITSITPYVDRLFVLLNDYEKIPDWLGAFKNVSPFLSKQENLDGGDAGKFFGLTKIRRKSFYYFSLDDDLIYPSDYVWKMILKIEQFGRRAIVGCGGYTMNSPVRHFYNDRKENWHISMPNTEDRAVQILHTGLCAWHSFSLAFGHNECKKANMSDLWLAIAAQRNHVPMILIQRPSNWVALQPNPLPKTIYGRFRNNCQEQTEVFNSIDNWILIPMEKFAAHANLSRD